MGAAGSGATTLGRALAAEWGVPCFDSDAYFWEPTAVPFSVRRPPDVRDQLLLDDLDREADWIVSGSVFSWSRAIHERFELIVFLFLPPALRLERLEARELRRYGPRIHTDPFWRARHETFMRYAKDYDEARGIAKRTLPAHRAWLSRQPTEVLELIGEMSVEERVRRVIDRAGR